MGRADREINLRGVSSQRALDDIVKQCETLDDERFEIQAAFMVPNQRNWAKITFRSESVPFHDVVRKVNGLVIDGQRVQASYTGNLPDRRSASSSPAPSTASQRGLRQGSTTSDRANTYDAFEASLDDEDYEETSNRPGPSSQWDSWRSPAAGQSGAWSARDDNRGWGSASFAADNDQWNGNRRTSDTWNGVPTSWSSSSSSSSRQHDDGNWRLQDRWGSAPRPDNADPWRRGHSSGPRYGEDRPSMPPPNPLRTAINQTQQPGISEPATSTRYEAPAPRAIAPLPERAASVAAAAAAASTSIGQQNGKQQPRQKQVGFDDLQDVLDTWELSLMDSDEDDDFIPLPPRNKQKSGSVVAEEWLEAFSLVKDFARNGGAILAVDVESWEQDHDYILEVGLAHVLWTPNNGTAPRVKSEHIIIEEHKGSKTNGIYSANKTDWYAFGESKTMKEFDCNTYLEFLITKYSKKGPLVLLFHNANAEKQYFELMGIDVYDCPGRLTPNLKDHIDRHIGNPDYWDPEKKCCKCDRSVKLVLDTQRLYRSYLLNHATSAEERRNPKVGLENVCKYLGIKTKLLHNAGNDALFTLQIFMRMAELHIRHTATSANSDGGVEREA